jgi:NMD protein affecting ribosome stability and mRNA decay
MSRARETQQPDYDPHCRRCVVSLTSDNARVSRGRFVGVCRPCESLNASERWANRPPGTRYKNTTPIMAFRVTPKTLKHLDELARRRGVTRSAIVREALAPLITDGRRS